MCYTINVKSVWALSAQARANQTSTIMAERRRVGLHRNGPGYKPYSRSSATEGARKDVGLQDVPRKTSSDADTLVVSNLHYEVMPADLKMVFEAMGTLAREPTIKYDRSGRSLGVAYVQFLDSKDAKVALDRLNGMSAKGKPMNIALDPGRKTPGFGRPPPTGPKSASLINRIASAPLVDRVAKQHPTISETNRIQTDNGKPTTGGKNARSGGHGRPGKSSGAGGGSKGNKPARVPKIPKTAEELDKELEAYLVDDSVGSGRTNGGDVVLTVAGTAPAAEDVEMA